MRLIDAEKLREQFIALYSNRECLTEKDSVLVECVDLIDNAPAVPMRGQELGCEICVNRNIKSKEVCTSPFGECKFFNCGAGMKGGAE